MRISEQTTGQLHEGFSPVLLGSKVNPETIPKFHVALHASHMAVFKINLKFLSKHRCPNVKKKKKKFVMTLPSKHKTEPKCLSSFLCCILTTGCYQHASFFTFQSATAFSVYLYDKDERAQSANLQNNKFFCSARITLTHLIVKATWFQVRWTWWSQSSAYYSVAKMLSQHVGEFLCELQVSECVCVCVCVLARTCVGDLGGKVRAFRTLWCDLSDEGRILTGSVMFIRKYTSCST